MDEKASGVARRPRRAERRPVAPGPRHRRTALYALYAAGGLSGASGAGLWLSRAADGASRGLSGVPPYAAVGIVVGLAGWAALLILGEVLLFVLAVINVDDREVHDRYRNLMILWGYVLTLGTSRFFRRLPAQFAQLFGDETARPVRAPTDSPHRDDRRRTRSRTG